MLQVRQLPFKSHVRQSKGQGCEQEGGEKEIIILGKQVEQSDEDVQIWQLLKQAPAVDAFV